MVQRSQRQRTPVDAAARRASIVVEARSMAEREGWVSVTSRSLSAALGFTQPVLYRAFGSMHEVHRAVAEAGFAELAEAVATHDDLGSIARAYLAYADAHPATYEAMFQMADGLGFATEEASAAMQASFSTIERAAGGPARAELVWSALHGMLELEHASRMPRAGRETRVSALTETFG